MSGGAGRLFKDYQRVLKDSIGKLQSYEFVARKSITEPILLALPPRSAIMTGSPIVAASHLGRSPSVTPPGSTAPYAGPNVRPAFSPEIVTLK